MKAVVQRVRCASVFVEGKTVSSIGPGLLVYLGIGRNSTDAGLDFMVRKITDMRLYPLDGREGVLSVREIDGEILLVSQFTLYGDARKGRRPSFSDAMPPDEARVFYEKALMKFQKSGVPTKGGIFQADMDVQSVNWGPYTILLESD